MTSDVTSPVESRAPTAGFQLNQQRDPISLCLDESQESRAHNNSESLKPDSQPASYPASPPLTESRLPWDKHHFMTLLHTLSLPYLLFRSSRQTKTPLFCTPLPLPSLNPVFSYKRSHSMLMTRDYIFFFFLFLSLPFSPPSSLLSSLCGGCCFKFFFSHPQKGAHPKPQTQIKTKTLAAPGLAWPVLVWRGVGAFLYFPYTPAGFSWHGFIGLWSKCT